MTERESPNALPAAGTLDRVTRDEAAVRDARGGAWTITTWIAVINVAVYVLGHILYPAREAVVGFSKVLVPSPVDRLCWFSFADAIANLQVWRFVTFQFVHANIPHLAGNLIGLIALGPVVEDYFGRRRFLAFYLLCGAAGPIAFLALQAMSAAPTRADATLVGASAGVFGVLVAAAVVAPREWVQLIFPPTPIRLRTAAALMLCVAGVTVFAYGRRGTNNAGGEAAHLGGAVMGYALIRRPQWLGGRGPGVDR